MKIGRITYSLSALAFIMSSSLNATTIKDVVEHTFVSNQDIVSKSINNDAFKKYIDEQEGGYYPKIDLTANVGVVDQNETVRGNSRTDTNHNGGNLQLDLEQLLYDGNLTPSLVEEAQARYSANKLKNSDDVENILFDGINAYLNILKYDERIKASKENLLVHEDYLSIATQTERINGEILDKVQTKAKIHSAKSNLFEETNNKSAATSSFVKNVGMPIDNNICKPVLNEGKIPATLEALQKSALENNYKILEQIESIKQQRAAIEKEKAGFLPTLKFKLQSLYDNDFADNEVKTNTYTAKVELKYNIFNGMVNSNRTEREVLFLKEVQAKLDVVTKSVLDEVTVAYETYNTAKKQIVELQQFIEENKQIISIYKDQFDAGTRNFIDVLNVEGDLYNSKLALINTEFTMYTAYYNILKATSSLQTTVVSSENQACEQVTTNKKANAADTSVQSLLAEDTATTTVETAKPAALTSGEYALLLESYTTNASAKMAVDTLGALPADVKSKIVANKNGSYTVALYNIDGLQNALELKNQFAAKFPKSYYIKKK
ncbi:TolC family protein [bacterium]|nr:TolC family protein [bacterium]